MQSLLQRCVIQGGVQVSQHVILVSTRSSNTGQTIDVSHIKGSVRRIINVFFRFLHDELELRGAHKAPAPHRKNILHERRRVFQRPLLRLISFQSLSNAAFCIRDKRMIFPLHAAHDEQRRFADAQQKGPDAATETRHQTSQLSTSGQSLLTRKTIKNNCKDTLRYTPHSKVTPQSITPHSKDTLRDTLVANRYHSKDTPDTQSRKCKKQLVTFRMSRTTEMSTYEYGVGPPPPQPTHQSTPSRADMLCIFRLRAYAEPMMVRLFARNVKRAHLSCLAFFSGMPSMGGTKGLPGLPGSPMVWSIWPIVFACGSSSPTHEVTTRSPASTPPNESLKEWVVRTMVEGGGLRHQVLQIPSLNHCPTPIP